MAAFAFGYRERYLAVAYTAFLSEQDGCHIDLVCTFARNENVGMAVRAGQPQGVLAVGEDHVRHRTFRNTHDIHVHDHRFGARVGALPTRLEIAIVQRLHPMHAVAQAGLGHRKAFVSVQWLLQDHGSFVGWVVYLVFARWHVRPACDLQ